MEKQLFKIVTVSNPAKLLLPNNVRQLRFDISEPSAKFLLKTEKNTEFVLCYKAADDKKSKLKFGCVVSVIQCYELPDQKSVMAIFQGERRCKIHKLVKHKDKSELEATISTITDIQIKNETKNTAYRRIIERELAMMLRNKVSAITSEIARTSTKFSDLGELVDFLALATLGKDSTNLLDKMMQEPDIGIRTELLVGHLSRLYERHRIDRQIRRRVKEQMEKTHHEFHLSEQVRAIQEELDEGDEQELETKIKKAGMSKAAEEKCLDEYHRLNNSPPLSPEAMVMRTYIETLLDLPWQARSQLKDDMRVAKKILDEDHFGLTKVKDRILEYLAVLRRTQKPQGSVMCFVGPPGVGKTSLGKSIARATGREFVRISLGGVHEEAAIRGHRKTYVASMPGLILKAMSKAKVRNPVFMLDEFDKVVSASGFHGDPAAALLEVLDPEQNSKFTDQYVEVDFDLSEVMFITTANHVFHLPDALLDRLETITIPGYSDQEKLAIAKQHLIPKQLEEHHIKASEVSFTDAILTEIIQDYTHEHGVRNLNRNIAKICRKLVTERLIEESKKTRKTKKSKKQKTTSKKINVTKKRVQELLEVPEFYSTFQMPGRPKVGYVNGLIYGFGVFRMEAVKHDAKSEGVSVTGITEGEKEINALVNVATSLLQSKHNAYGLPVDFNAKQHLHIHLQDTAITPYGALGLGIFALIVSIFTKCPVLPKTALIGEINLRGDVISSQYYSEYKSTVMDAQRKKIKRIIMPQEDAKLLADLPKNLTESIEFVLIKNVWEALGYVLAKQPQKSILTTNKQKISVAPERISQQNQTKH